jgi:hypothetical protein
LREGSQFCDARDTRALRGFDGLLGNEDLTVNVLHQKLDTVFDVTDVGITNGIKVNKDRPSILDILNAFESQGASAEGRVVFD